LLLLETIPNRGKAVTESIAPEIRERVSRIESTPAVPAILLPLLNLLKLPSEDISFDEVVRLVSYDKGIAAQCIRVASSPLFGLAKSPKSVSAAVVSLGLRRVESVLLTCCMGRAFPVGKWGLDPAAFWRHSLGCAMVCRKLSEKLGVGDGEETYMAGLLHDIGFLANCMVYPKEFSMAVEQATKRQIPLGEAELAVMGFTHCETGRAMAEQWKLGDDTIQVIAHHHHVERSESAHGLVALVHLSDLLCRMRGLGYGYYERGRVDMPGDVAWAMLLKEYKHMQGMDLARFTFELDDAVSEISELVSAVFGAPSL
jgi:putative nucleotidyltransferase with HDIG domain